MLCPVMGPKGVSDAVGEQGPQENPPAHPRGVGNALGGGLTCRGAGAELEGSLFQLPA